MTWRPVLSVKLSAERFEQRMKVKIIIDHKSVIEEQNDLQFQTNLQSWSGVCDHQFEYVFTDEIRKPSFSWTIQVFGFEQMLFFYQEICFSFMIDETCKL